MGTIVCRQSCEQIVAHFDDEKVSTLYAVCPHCESYAAEAKEESHLRHEDGFCFNHAKWTVR